MATLSQGVNDVAKIEARNAKIKEVRREGHMLLPVPLPTTSIPYAPSSTPD